MFKKVYNNILNSKQNKQKKTKYRKMKNWFFERIDRKYRVI